MRLREMKARTPTRDRRGHLMPTITPNKAQRTMKVVSSVRGRRDFRPPRPPSDFWTAVYSNRC